MIASSRTAADKMTNLFIFRSPFCEGASPRGCKPLLPWIGASSLLPASPHRDLAGGESTTKRGGVAEGGCEEIELVQAGRVGILHRQGEEVRPRTRRAVVLPTGHKGHA